MKYFAKFAKFIKQDVKIYNQCNFIAYLNNGVMKYLQIGRVDGKVRRGKINSFSHMHTII